VLLLAFDTATSAVTVALHDGDHVIARTTTSAVRQHGEFLAASIAALLSGAGAATADLTAVAVGTGPGPYTGLRAGLVTGRVLASALRIQADGVCSLDVIALAAAAESGGREFLVATDARRKEVYWARYDESGGRVDGPRVDRPAEIADEVRGLAAVGAGALLYPEVFAAPAPGLPEHQSAAALAAFAAGVLAAGGELPAPVPLYLRRPDAEVPKNYKTVLPA